jgi:hypothetical protein
MWADYSDLNGNPKGHCETELEGPQYFVSRTGFWASEACFFLASQL